MIYLDTSFLFSLFVEQTNSSRATRWMNDNPETLWISSFSIFEFEQALRLQLYLFKQDRSRGLSRNSVNLAMSHFRASLEQGVFCESDYDWKKVLELASRLSSEYTESKGYRTMDMIHVSLALHLGSDEFLTFDAKQKKLAQAEGLKVPF
jgi:predicted nucleic acid-binding protein